MSLEFPDRIDEFRDQILSISEITSILKRFKDSTIQLDSESPLKTLSSSHFELTKRDSSTLLCEINELVQSANQAIAEGENFCFSIPSRSKSNQYFSVALGRTVLGKKTRQRCCLGNELTEKRFKMTLRVLTLIRYLLSTDTLVTKDFFFRSDIKLFGGQRQADRIVDDVSYMLRCTQSCFPIFHFGKGTVVGNLTFKEDGIFVDCRRVVPIPPVISKVSDIKSEALFILLVARDVDFMQIVDLEFHKKFPCIVFSSNGMPDLATRQFLSILKMELKLPVLAFVDWDPHAFKILYTFMYGSYNSFQFTTPDIKLLGLRHVDVKAYSLPRSEMQNYDIQTAKKLLKRDFIKLNVEWEKELKLMLELNEKVETHALSSSLGFMFTQKVFLPLKLQKMDWI